MRQIIVLAVALAALAYCGNSGVPTGADRVPPMNYELYSWQESDGNWSFRVLASPSGVNVSATQVFDKKFLLSGVKDLKRKISGLPVGATIIWLDRTLLSSGEKTNEKKLAYPPPEMIQDIRRYAETRKIKMEVLSDQKKRE